MALESASYINQLNAANPSGADRIHQGDDHIRLLKAVLKATFPNFTGPLELSQDEIAGLRDSLVPVGIIAAWYGTADAVPTGWAICNGQTVARTDGSGDIITPDLRDRVVVGAGGTYDVGDTAGSTTSSATTGAAGSHSHTVSGGAHTHGGQVQSTALTIAQIPSHTHGNSVVHDTNGIFSRGTKAIPTHSGRADYHSGSGSFEGISEAIGGGQAHNHGLSIDSATHSHTVSSEGDHTHSVQVSTLQPSGALHFIMKV